MLSETELYRTKNISQPISFKQFRKNVSIRQQGLLSYPLIFLKISYTASILLKDPVIKSKILRGCNIINF
jgi:hypothetical protein